MRFRHKRTGAIIDVPSKLSGPWEPVDGGVTTAQASPEPEAIEEVEETKAEEKPKARRKKKS